MVTFHSSRMEGSVGKFSVCTPFFSTGKEWDVLLYVSQRDSDTCLLA